MRALGDGDETGSISHPHPSSPARVRRREQHQDLQVVAEVEEAMLDVGGDEDDAAGADGLRFVADEDLAGALRDDVNLVLRWGTWSSSPPPGRMYIPQLSESTRRNS